jgi:YD repeat-containing protein
MDERGERVKRRRTQSGFFHPSIHTYTHTHTHAHAHIQMYDTHRRRVSRHTFKQRRLIFGDFLGPNLFLMILTARSAAAFPSLTNGLVNT